MSTTATPAPQSAPSAAAPSRVSHSPAPWHPASSLSSHVLDANGVTVADSVMMGRSYDEQRANRDLIAAAPELLAVLREYVADTRNLAINEEIERTRGAVTPWLARHRRALTVIAKAEGSK